MALKPACMILQHIIFIYRGTSPESALKPRVHIFLHSQTRSILKGLFPGIWLARVKHPQPRCSSNVKPSAYKPPACKPGEESDAGLSGSRTINLRHRGSRQPPQGPAWPWRNYLPDVGVFPLCRQEDYYYCRIRAGIPYIYWRLCLLTPDSVVYWVT